MIIKNYDQPFYEGFNQKKQSKISERETILCSTKFRTRVFGLVLVKSDEGNTLGG